MLNRSRSIIPCAVCRPSVLDDGEVLIDSVTILDHLDALAGAMKALIAPAGPARRQALKICALATGLADKAVSLVYERVLHQQVSQAWIDRCVAQVAGVLDTLQTDRAGRATSFWFGEIIGHADIAVACALRFTTEAHPTLFDLLRWPSLAAYAARCEALAPFQAVTQPFIPPA